MVRRSTAGVALLLVLVASGPGCRLAAQDPPATATPAPAPQGPDLNALRARAFAAENRGDHLAAGDAFLELVKAEPGRVDWVIAAGRCLGRSGRFAEAIKLLDGGRQQFPTSNELLAMLAGTLLLQSETPGLVAPEVLWADAAELAESVLTHDPDHEDCRLILAQAHYLLGDRERAIADAEEAVRRFPQRAGAHVLRGRIAADAFRRLLSQHEREQPTGEAAAELVARIDAERRLARRSFERAAALDATRAHPHVALAQLAQLDHQDAAARAHLLDALAVDPEVPVDHDRLMQELSWQARRDAYRTLTQRYLATAKARPAKAATLAFHEGRASFQGLDWAAARERFTQALADNPALTNSLYYLFLCDYRLGDVDAAEQHAAAFAANSAPGFADVLRALDAEQRGEVGAIVQFLAHRAFQQQRLPRSRDLNHVLACLRDAADAWNNHAFLCRETGQFEQALTSYEYALQREPDSPQLWNDTGVVLQYHLASPANLTRARLMYERAIELADKVLADARSSQAARDQAGEAKKNATANLAELPR